MKTKRILSVILALSLAVSLVGCAKLIPAERYTYTVPDAFDTISKIIAYDTSEAEFYKKAQALEEKMTEYDRLFDIYNTYDGITNLCTVNEQAADAPVKVGQEIMELLQYGKEAYKLSRGTVNICYGAVLGLWHNAQQRGTPPSKLALKEVKGHDDIDDLVLDTESSTVYFKDPLLMLDVGAIAKGFVADKLKDYLLQNNIWSDFTLNLGGNVVTAGYKNSDGATKWNVQIENPKGESEEALVTLTITDLSLVTSGDYQRYFEYEGKRYCHIIDPATAQPAGNFKSVSVLCRDSRTADTLSTALFILPLEEGKKLIEGMENTEALWVDQNNIKTASAGFEAYLSDF